MRWMPTPIVAASACLAILAVTGCGPADNTNADLRQTLIAEETLRIGSVDDPETSLTFFFALERDAEGRIYTVHSLDGTVRIHSPDGDPLGSIGGRGEGPGEFQSPSALGVEGEELWVVDGRAGRVSYFALDGEFLRDERFRAEAPEVEEGRFTAPPNPFGRLNDGTLLAMAPVLAQDITSGTVTEAPVLHMSIDGTILDTVAMRPFGGGSIQLDNGQGGSTFTGQPFSDAPFVAFSASREEALFVDRSVSGGETSFRITKLRFVGDTVFDRTYDFEPTLLTDAVADSVLGGLAEQLAERGFFTLGRALSELDEKAYVPPHLTPITSVRPGEDGTTWIGLNDLDPDERAWLVLLPNGDPWGEVVLPESFRPMLATRDEAWGMEQDELDVPYIVTYTIRPARAEEVGR